MSEPHDEEAPLGDTSAEDVELVDAETPAVEDSLSADEDGPDESAELDEADETDEADESDVLDESVDAVEPAESKGRRDVMIVGGVLVALLGALVGLMLLTGGSNDPVYTVFDQEVSRDDLAERLDGFLDPTTVEAVDNVDDATAEQRSQLAQAISSFITEDAMVTAAQADGIEIAEAAVDSQIDEIVETGFEGDESQFEAAIAESGQTLGLVRIQFRTALYAEALVGEAEPVTEDDVQSFYDSNFTAPLVSHILVETEQEAQDAKDRIDGGEEFEAVATEVSLDSSAAQGGRLGPLESGLFVEPFEEAAEALEPGELSNPVETQFGWHIITVDPPPALADVADQVRLQIEENRLNDEFLALATQLDDEAMITVDPAFGSWQGLGGGGLVPAGLNVDEGPAQLPEAVLPPADSEE